MIILLDGFAAIVERRVPPGDEARAAHARRCLALVAAPLARRGRPVARRASTSTAATASPATAAGGAGSAGRRRSGRARCAPRTQQHGRRPVAARRRRARGRLLPAHRLHAAPARRHRSRAAAASSLSDGQIEALTAYVASLGPRAARSRRRTRSAATSRRASTSSPSTAPAATRSSPQGGYVTGARRAAARATRRRRSRRGRPDRPVRDAALLEDGRSRDRELDSIVAYVEYAKHPGRPRRLGDRPHRPGAGGPRHLVHRGCRRSSASAWCIGKRLQRWVGPGTALIAGRRAARCGARKPPAAAGPRERERIVPPGAPEPGARAARRSCCFSLGALCAVAFVVVYALDRLPAHTQLLGALARPRPRCSSPPR